MHTKNPYIIPATTVSPIGASHLLMASGGEGDTPSGNVNNIPAGGIVAF